MASFFNSKALMPHAKRCASAWAAGLEFMRRAASSNVSAVGPQAGRIVDIRTTPLLIDLKRPYHQAYGVSHAATTILVEVETKDGVIGYGECIGTPSVVGIQAYLEHSVRGWHGRSVFESRRLVGEAYQRTFREFGTHSAARFSGQILGGLEMALWDAAGRTTGLPVHELMGGRVHDTLQFFAFVQGETPEELASDAALYARDGFEVFYVKLGRGDALDTEIVRQIRQVIGPTRRLRVDANEAWDPLRFSRMVRAIEQAGGPIEFVEQPCKCESIPALAQIRSRSPVAISADQSVFTPEEALEVVKQQAGDLVLLGLHEVGGITRFLKAAAIAEAGGLNVCLHGLFESGITTYAAIQAASLVPNIDDGNQYMNHLLSFDIVSGSGLKLDRGRLNVPTLPGLGFDIDPAAVQRAALAYNERVSE